MQTLTKAPPAKLLHDGWWLDHDRHLCRVRGLIC